MRTLNSWLAAALLATGLPFTSAAKGYSSGGHSYSSHSSHSSSAGRSHSSSGGSKSLSSGSGSTHSSSSGGSGSSKSFKSGSGKSYSAGSTRSDQGRHGYTSSKSYTSGTGHKFSSGFGNERNESATPAATPKRPAAASSGQFAFDTAAAHARKEEASRQEFARFKESQAPPSTVPSAAPRSDLGTRNETAGAAPSYRVTPPPLSASDRRSYYPTVYVPDAGVLSTRSVRIYNVFNPYSTRPVVIYRDPYNSFFWWWLLDRSLEDRAWWTYHHRYDMDPARYQALVANDRQLEARVEQLEGQQAPRDPNYTPTGLDRDLMYSDQYVARVYSNRPTTLGVITFWIVAVPMALGVSGFFIWLIWFKRWQTAT